MIIKIESDRNLLRKYFEAKLSDKEIADALNVAVRTVVATRIDMGLVRKNRLEKKNAPDINDIRCDTTGMSTKTRFHKKAGRSDQKINPYAIIRMFADHGATMSMHAIARKFGCSKQYVHGHVQKAIAGELLDEKGRLYNFNPKSEALRIRYEEERQAQAGKTSHPNDR